MVKNKQTNKQKNVNNMSYVKSYEINVFYTLPMFNINKSVEKVKWRG